MPQRADPPGFRSLRVLALIFILISPLSIRSYSQYFKQEHEDDEERSRKTRPDLESRIPQRADSKSKQYTIGVRVDLVMMYTSVFDKNGRFIGGLTEDNFKVYEDGVEQKVSYFAQEDVPVSMGILIDLSGSMRGKIEQVKKAALAFIRAGNPQDQVFLIAFNDEVELIQDFTSDIEEIADSLENTVVTGGTALYDAVYLGVQKAQSGIKAKKAVVVITDGEDRDSYYKLDELITKVQESDVQVFCVGFLNTPPEKGLFGRWSKSIPEKAQEALERISEETGGKAFFPDKLTDIHAIVSEIAGELRSQYSIGYFSSNTARDGAFRRVKVEVRGATPPPKQIRYRRGYFAPKQDTAG
jgi:Ca-activated chloride channel family protein